MANSFNKLFWGFLIVILDFRINTFDIIIDTVGYFIVVSALSALSSHSKSFEKAKHIAIVLALLSIPTIIELGTTINLDQGFVPTSMLIGTLLYGTILGLLHLIVAYEIFSGMLDLSRQLNFEKLSKRVKNKSRFYIIISFITLSLAPLVFNIGDSVGMYMVVGIGIASFIVELIFIFLIREFRNLYRMA